MKGQYAYLAVVLCFTAFFFTCRADYLIDNFQIQQGPVTTTKPGDDKFTTATDISFINGERELNVFLSADNPPELDGVGATVEIPNGVGRFTASINKTARGECRVFWGKIAGGTLYDLSGNSIIRIENWQSQNIGLDMQLTLDFIHPTLDAIYLVTPNAGTIDIDIVNDIDSGFVSAFSQVKGIEFKVKFDFERTATQDATLSFGPIRLLTVADGGSDGTTGADDGSPTDYSDGVPTDSDGVQTDSDGVPTDSDGVPTDSDGGPTDSDGGPTDSDGGPTDSDGGPTEPSDSTDGTDTGSTDSPDGTFGADGTESGDGNDGEDGVDVDVDGDGDGNDGGDGSASSLINWLLIL